MDNEDLQKAHKAYLQAEKYFRQRMEAEKRAEERLMLKEHKIEMENLADMVVKKITSASLEKLIKTGAFTERLTLIQRKKERQIADSFRKCAESSLNVVKKQINIQ